MARTINFDSVDTVGCVCPHWVPGPPTIGRDLKLQAAIPRDAVNSCTPHHHTSGQWCGGAPL
eukprot:6558661-Pyramimonas_sp.AAC.1